MHHRAQQMSIEATTLINAMRAIESGALQGAAVGVAQIRDYFALRGAAHLVDHMIRVAMRERSVCGHVIDMRMSESELASMYALDSGTYVICLHIPQNR